MTTRYCVLFLYLYNIKEKFSKIIPVVRYTNESDTQMIDFFLIPGIDHRDVGSVVKVVEYGGVSRSFSALILHIISQNAWLCQ